MDDDDPPESTLERFHHLEVLYANIEESAHIGVWELELPTGLMVWSHNMYHLLGLSSETFKPTREVWKTLVHPEDLPRLRSAVVACVTLNVPFSEDGRIIRSDGETRYFHGWGRPVADRDGIVVGLVGTCQDVTEAELRRRQAMHSAADFKQRLDENAAKLAYRGALLTAEQETALDGILVVDPQGRIQSYNRRFVEMWGLSEDDLRPASDEVALAAAVEKVVSPKAFVERVKWLYAHPIEKSFDEVRLVDGRTFERYSSPVLEGTRNYGRVWYFRDVTERRQAEAELRRSAEELERSNSDLDMFASTAAHDLAAPLRKIDMFGGLLENRTASKLDAEEKELLSRMRISARRLGGLIDELLDLSRAERGSLSPGPVDLNALIRELLSDSRGELSAAGASVKAGDLPEVEGLAPLLRGLFANLLSNALKFRDKGRPLCIEISSRPTRSGGVEVYVKDNGIGFESSRCGELFVPFHRLHADPDKAGYGLGLAIAARVARRHGGFMSASGEPGKGAVFTLTLPAAVVLHKAGARRP
jgi:PAS domain S-box-containing protein